MGRRQLGQISQPVGCAEGADTGRRDCPGPAPGTGRSGEAVGPFPQASRLEPEVSHAARDTPGGQRARLRSGPSRIPGYDSLSASQVVQRLAGLSQAELVEVRDLRTVTPPSPDDPQPCRAVARRRRRRVAARPNRTAAARSWKQPGWRVASDAERCAELCRQALDALQHVRGGPLFARRETGLVAKALLRPGGLDRLMADHRRRVLVGTVDDAVVGLALGRIDARG